MSTKVIEASPGEPYGSSAFAAASIWVEKNCYADLWTSLLHTMGLEARAWMPAALAIDFFGDQWTFFKPSHHDLRELYGIDVQELTVWRPLLDHAEEHLSAGRLIATESDAFWLPDTAGTDYRTKHTKTTILINEVDRSERRLGYFHNAGYFQLCGEDFDRTFAMDDTAASRRLPLFAELVILDGVVSRTPETLRTMSLELVKRYLERRPAGNPVERFAQRFRSDLPSMQALGLDHYHAWAFAATRQLGAAAEVVAQNLLWTGGPDPAHFNGAASQFAVVASLAKSFILKGARAVASRREFDDGGILDAMAESWARGMASLCTSLTPVAVQPHAPGNESTVELESVR